MSLKNWGGLSDGDKMFFLSTMASVLVFLAIRGSKVTK